MNLEQLLPLMQTYFAEGKTVSFCPHGVSMRPMLEGGRDTVMLTALPQTLSKNDVILYRRPDGQFVLHRLLRIEDDCFIFCGDGQFAPETVKKEQMLALLCAFTRKGKACRTDAPAYRAYIALWNASRPLRFFVFRACGWIKRRVHT